MWRRSTLSPLLHLRFCSCHHPCPGFTELPTRILVLSCPQLSCRPPPRPSSLHVVITCSHEQLGGRSRSLSWAVSRSRFPSKFFGTSFGRCAGHSLIPQDSISLANSTRADSRKHLVLGPVCAPQEPPDLRVVPLCSTEALYGATGGRVSSEMARVLFGSCQSY